MRSAAKQGLVNVHRGGHLQAGGALALGEIGAERIETGLLHFVGVVTLAVGDNAVHQEDAGGAGLDGLFDEGLHVGEGFVGDDGDAVEAVEGGWGIGGELGWAIGAEGWMIDRLS